MRENGCEVGIFSTRGEASDYQAERLADWGSSQARIAELGEKDAHQPSDSKCAEFEFLSGRY